MRSNRKAAGARRETAANIFRRGAGCLRTLVVFCLLGHANLFAHQAPPMQKLDFVPPPVGSYQLARIMPVPQGQVLDVDGQRKPLAQFTTGKVTLLSFIYTTCVDAGGCPTAYTVFAQLKRQISARAELRDRVRFVSLSFDPLRDTPRVMKAYGGSHVKKRDGLDWYFLTTKSPRDLLPLLDGFGQDVQVGVNAKTGKATRELSHVLKVFLIDKQGQTREIYTTAFLLPEMVLNDIQTLLLEDGVNLSAAQ